MWDLDPTFRYPPTLINSLEKSFTGSGYKHSALNALVPEESINEENRGDVTLPSVCDMGPSSGIRPAPWEPCEDYKFNLPYPSAWLADHNTDFSIAPRSALKSVSFCPYNPHLLMSSGYESAIKVRHWLLVFGYRLFTIICDHTALWYNISVIGSTAILLTTLLLILHRINLIDC